MRSALRVWRLAIVFLVSLPALGWAGTGIDYADSRYAGLWLRHPVYGDPSFDSFVHAPLNPLHRGVEPFEWPVNSFFFADPVGGNWYIYVGDYPKGYASRTSRCVLLRSTDRGRSWSNLGVVLEGSKELFDQGGSTPDVSIVYADGRYHMVYDWCAPDWQVAGGLAYAWADKPEGPFHRATTPITVNQKLKPLLGRYQRTYAATLVRRKHDWMIVGMMDRAPNSWALFGITSPKPEGPYGERVLLRNVEQDGFHPPLLEYYPAFVHDGFLYAPATSVALNRDFNALFRAPLERADQPAAWELVQNGSVWHADDLENEYYGIWGQTFSGWVDAKSMLQVSFHSRDPQGMGTVNIAARPWNQPLRKSGFVMAGHQGPSLTLLERAFPAFRLDARLRVHGSVSLLLDYRGALGPSLPQSDATLHPSALSRCDTVELDEGHWKLVRYSNVGKQTVLASGIRPGSTNIALSLDREPGGVTRLFVDDRALWSGVLDPSHGSESSDGPEFAPPALGLLVAPHSHLEAEAFTIQGKPKPAVLNYLFTEGILGAGGNREDWQDLKGADYRFGAAAVSKAPGARVKWNVQGQQFTLWSPRGPQFGKVQVKVDGRALADLDLRADHLTSSQPVWKSPRFKDKPHAVVLTGTNGLVVVDSLSVLR
jgi:hypothetical protein